MGEPMNCFNYEVDCIFLCTPCVCRKFIGWRDQVAGIWLRLSVGAYEANGLSPRVEVGLAFIARIAFGLPARKLRNCSRVLCTFCANIKPQQATKANCGVGGPVHADRNGATAQVSRAKHGLLDGGVLRGHSHSHK